MLFLAASRSNAPCPWRRHVRCGAVVQSLNTRGRPSHTARGLRFDLLLPRPWTISRPRANDAVFRDSVRLFPYVKRRHSHRNLRVWRGSLRRRWWASGLSVRRPTPVLPRGPCSSRPRGKCPRRRHLGREQRRVHCGGAAGLGCPGLASPWAERRSPGSLTVSFSREESPCDWLPVTPHHTTSTRKTEQAFQFDCKTHIYGIRCLLDTRYVH